MPSAPNSVIQTPLNCYNACIQSIDNTWGGSYVQSSSPSNSLVGYTAGTSSLSNIKDNIANGSYVIVQMTGGPYGGQHWVVAYSATAASSTAINVMDPYDGAYKSLSSAITVQQADGVNSSRVAYKNS